MKSFMARKEDCTGNWVLVDASDVILGRLASKVAMILMGKTKPTYTPHVDTGDYVIVVNAEKIKVTGRKDRHLIWLPKLNRKHVHVLQLSLDSAPKGVPWRP